MKAAVARGLLTPEQLRDCLALHSQLSQAGSKERLIDVITRQGLLTPEQIKSLQSNPTIPGYDIESLIGKGGMGSVYKARQASTGRVVAIKILSPELSGQKHLIQRFTRESRTAIQVVHPNIVAAYEAGEANGYFYYAMEFVEGIGVDEMIRRKKQLEERVALDITRQIALALDALHAAKIVHRDVKPQNIMVSKDGIAKLCDLGLARFEANENSTLTATGTIVGTPYYISPEQIEGRKDIDTRTDIYSLGGTLFAMLTGRPPYMGDSAMAIVAKHMKDPIPDPRQLNRAVSERASTVIAKCMKKHREDRFKNPKELVFAIDGLLAPPKAQSTTRAMRLTTTTSRLLTSRRSSPGAPTGAIAVAVLLALLAGGFIIAMGNRSTRARPAPRPVNPVETIDDSAAQERFDSLKKAIVDGHWEKIRKEAHALLSEHSDSPTVKANRVQLEAWIAEANAADKSRRDACVKDVADARALASSGKWVEAVAAFERVLAKHGSELGSEAGAVRLELETARKEVEGTQALVSFDAMPAEDWKARSAALERLQVNYGSTRAVRARQADWLGLAQQFKQESDADDMLTAAKAAAAKGDWAKADELLGRLSASFTATTTFKSNSSVIAGLISQVDQHRSAQTEERLTQILTEAAKEFTAQEWSKAKDLYLLARTKFGTTAPYKQHESKINEMIARCDEQLSRQLEDQALRLMARARFEYRDKKWSAAAALLDQVFTLFGNTQAFQRQRRELEQMRSDCDRNRSK